MRRFSLLFLTLLLCQLTNGQNLTVRYQSGGAPVNMTTSNISSDFGRRHSVWGTSWSPSPWHMGVDYAFPGCNGIPIISITSGRVSRIENLNPTGTTHYKILTIDGGTWSDATQNATFADNTNDFGYGHIFNDNDIGNGILSGNFVFLRMDGNNSNRFAILNLNITPHVAIGEVEGTVTYNGNPYNVSTRVDNDQLIAPIGGSGGFAAHPHLHLYRPLNPDNNVQTLSNAKNPFEAIQHENTNYTVTISGLNRLTNTSTTLPVWYECDGQSKNSALKVNVSMNTPTKGITYTNTVYDIEDVRVLIKKSYEADNLYKLIQGRVLESRITMGGRLNNVRYPAVGEATNPIDIAWKSTDGTSINGSYTKTGIEPHAYHDQNYDIFFFADIYTRIHKNQVQGISQQLKLAPVGKLARYPDGKYNIIARASRISPSNPLINSTASTIIIDNFRPYVEKIEILNNGLKYSAEWKPTADETALSLITIDEGQLDKCFPTTIQVTFSEPMQTPVLKTGQTPLQAYGQTNNITWYYTIPAMNNLSSSTQLNITGKDLAGNDLIALPQTSTSFSLTNFPVRTSSTAFSNSGLPTTESNYWLRFSAQKDGTGCNTYAGNVPNANFIFQASSTNSNIINFTNTSINSEAYYWEFGDGQTSSVPNPGVIEYPIQQESEIYTVKLTAYGINGVVSTKIKTIFIPGLNNNSSIVIYAYHSPTTVLNKIQFDCNVSGGVSGRYNITMHYGDGNTKLYTNSLGWESWNYQYVTPAIATTYNPFVVVEELNEYGLTISENHYQLMPLDIGPEVLENLDLSIQMLDINNNAIYNLIQNKKFRFKASCSNYHETLVWQWVIYNTNIPNATTMQCQPENGCKVFWGNASLSHTTPLIDAFTQVGTYFAQLTVFGGGYSKIVDMVITVKSEDSDCVYITVESFGCTSYVSKGSTLCFQPWYLSIKEWDDLCRTLYGGIPKIEWFVSDQKKLTLERCNSGNFLNLQFAGSPYSTLNYNLCGFVIEPLFYNHHLGYFKYKFTDKGNYDIKAIAYAGQWSFPSSGGSIGQYLKPITTVFSKSTKRITVVDCNETLIINSSSSLQSNTINGVVKRGNIIVEGKVTADSQQTGLLVFEANNSIVLKPGFSTKNGSRVLLKIDPCPPLVNCSYTPWAPYKIVSEALDTDILESKGVSIYPNPNEGYFRVELIESEQIKKIEVVNSVGKLIDLRENVYSNSCELNLTDEPDGLYLIRVYSLKGENFFGKVIKQKGQL